MFLRVFFLMVTLEFTMYILTYWNQLQIYTSLILVCLFLTLILSPIPCAFHI